MTLFSSLSLKMVPDRLGGMELTEPNGELLIVLRELYPQLSEDEQVEARERFEQYLKIVGEIYQRLQDSPELRERYEHLKREYRLLTGLDEPNESGSFSAPKSG